MKTPGSGKLIKLCRNLAFAVLGSFLLAVGSVSAQSDSPFKAQEKEAIEEIVRQYLRENPEVIIDALREFQERQRLAEEQRQRQAVVANLDLLQNDPLSPVIGNPEGDVVLVEFFDYRCPYCKVTAPRLQALLNEDPNLKVVMKEFPILSEESVQGARAALAAHKQGKYAQFHFALMDNPGNLGERHLRAVAKETGLDPEKLIEDMQSPEIDEAIRRNHTLGRAIGVRGTPAIVIGETLLPGAVELDQLREVIAAARKEAS